MKRGNTMNKKILFVPALGLMLVGCAPMDPSACPMQNSQRCTGDPQTPSINVNTQAAQLRANPYCVKAKAGTPLVFRLTPPGNKDEGIVVISPKDPANAWLAGTNDEYQDLIIIKVPEEIPDGNYDYKIETDDKCVDPRVNVD